MFGVFEHDDVAPMKIGGFHRDHAVAHLQGVLHRLRRDDEHLSDETTQHS